MALNSVVKPQKLAAVAAEIIEQSVVVAGLFQREGFEQFQGSESDTVYIRVPGVLPAHDIADFRAERSSPIDFDAYTERKISLTLSGNTYSATKLQDEQRDWDNVQWARVITTQAEAVARSLEAKAVTALTDAPYLATIGGAVTGRPGASGITALRASLTELRRVANAFRMPKEQRFLVVGTGVEAAMLRDADLIKASTVGDEIASAALREAIIGRLYGMTVVVSDELPSDKGYLIVPSAFVQATAAPSVPQSATGGSASARTFAARWILDYDPTILAERSVVNTYNGRRHVTDVMLNAAKDNVIVNGTGTVGEFFIRGVAFDVDATADVLPDADANADADGTGGTPAANSLLDQFVAATGVGAPFVL